MAEIEVEGCRIAYECRGDPSAPALVCLAALGTSRSLFARQTDALSRDHRLLLVDLRGHGDSDAPAGPYSIEQLGRDVIAVLDAESIPRASVLGVSIGGVIALWLAAHAPARVSRLVLANTAARVGTEAQWNERIALVREHGLAAMCEPMLERWFSARFRREHPAVVAEFGRALMRCEPNGYAGCCGALASADLREAVAGIRAQSLVIVGVHDLATPPEEGAWLQAQLPVAELLELEAAHFSNVEDPARFTQAVLEFLKSSAV